MNAAERALFADTVAQLTMQHSGDDLDAALGGLG